ncbi:MAG TPA: GntR family transcriptional regulator, partial [Marinilabiliales bacterium]|nr:GntR family transcriptional regulator [Marinilabiliales bacterium]
MSPKYIVISKEVIQKIEAGELQPGDKIPSENELIKNYNISNTTARKCLLELEHKGWATRIKGKGTFVLNRTEDKRLTRVLGSFHAIKESFSDNLKREGFTPKNIILEKTILENGISSNINGRHYIMEGYVLKIHRLRYGNELLLKDETKYISMNCCPKMNYPAAS